MPYYEFLCTKCNRIEPHYHKIDERDAVHPHCDQPMQRIISKPFIRPEIQPFVSPASGKVINSRAQRRDDMARTGSIDNEPGMREHIEQVRQSHVEKNIRACEASIDQTVSELHASGHINGD